MDFTVLDRQLVTRQRRVADNSECPNLYVRGALAVPAIGLALVRPDIVAACRSYRDACRVAYLLQRPGAITMRQLAESAGLYPSHMTDYLSDEERKRELPARHIQAFQAAVGNAAIVQWLAMRAGLGIVGADAAFGGAGER